MGIILNFSIIDPAVLQDDFKPIYQPSTKATPSLQRMSDNPWSGVMYLSKAVSDL
jgi:hypothetical protein